MSYNLPPSLALLQCIAVQCEKITPVLTPKTDYHKEINKWINTDEGFEQFISENPSKLYIHYIQTLMLVVLSMYGGILIPPIKQFSHTNGHIRIVWDSGIVDDFTLGLWDDSFSQFSRYFQNRLSAKPTGNQDIYPALLKGFQQYIQSYQVILDAVGTRLMYIIGNKLKLMGVLEDKENKDLLFILLSSLPSEQMNALFVYIQQFFPESLTYKTQRGNVVNVIATFQTPATDMLYLIEKTKLYMELYYDNNHPIIQEITQSKTTEFMKKIMQTDQVFSETQRNLKILKEMQVDIRSSLYQLIDTHLSRVLQSCVNV